MHWAVSAPRPGLLHAHLLALLSDPDELPTQGDSVAVHAAPALAAIGGDAKAKMLRILLAQLNSLESEARNRARRSLFAVGTPILADLFQTMADARTTQCIQIELLYILTPMMSGLPYGQVVARWSDEHPPGPAVLAMVPVLKTLVRHDDGEVRRLAVGILATIDPQAAEVPEMFLASFEAEQPDPDSRWFSGIMRPAMIPGLTKGLVDERAEIRLATVGAIAMLAEKLADSTGDDQTVRPDPVRPPSRPGCMTGD